MAISDPDDMTIEQLRSEVRRWRGLYLDQPEDRLYHAQDDIWWRRDDTTYQGVGRLFRTSPPSGYERVKKQSELDDLHTIVSQMKRYLRS